jgi:hypothetical protein
VRNAPNQEIALGAGRRNRAEDHNAGQSYDRCNQARVHGRS